MLSKKAGIMQSILVQLILIALIFGLFMFASAQKINSRGVRQQIVEKQTALLIDSAVPGMSFEISKVEGLYGGVDSLRLNEGKVHAGVSGLPSEIGYPYFSPYKISVESLENKFLVKIYE